jgi:hypothetical protein
MGGDGIAQKQIGCLLTGRLLTPSLQLQGVKIHKKKIVESERTQEQ